MRQQKVSINAEILMRCFQEGYVGGPFRRLAESRPALSAPPLSALNFVPLTENFEPNNGFLL